MPLVAFLGVLIAIVILWRALGSGGGVTGVGEGLRTTVNAPQEGVLQQLLVEPYQDVEAGQAVAILLPSDPRLRLDLLQAELQMANLQAQPSLAQETAIDLERLRAELWRTKSELAVATVNLERAENQVRRNEPLFKEELVSEDLFDLSLKTRDMFRAEMDAKSNAVAALDARVNELADGGLLPNQPGHGSVETWPELQALRSAMETNLAPITLRAPITGKVGWIYRRPGENLVAGEPLLGVHSIWSDRIVAYLRQPYAVDPVPGTPVEIITRERRRRSFASQIIHVGAQVEVITNALAIIRPNALLDAGLPVVVDLPPALQLRPGEMVDLALTTAAPVAEPQPEVGPTAARAEGDSPQTSPGPSRTDTDETP